MSVSDGTAELSCSPCTAAVALTVGARVRVRDGRYFRDFGAGDRGVVLAVDAEAGRCEVAFDGRAPPPLPVSLRHLELEGAPDSQPGVRPTETLPPQGATDADKNSMLGLIYGGREPAPPTLSSLTSASLRAPGEDEVSSTCGHLGRAFREQPSSPPQFGASSCSGSLPSLTESSAGNQRTAADKALPPPRIHLGQMEDELSFGLDAASDAAPSQPSSFVLPRPISRVHEGGACFSTADCPQNGHAAISPPPRLILDELQDASSDAPHDPMPNSDGRAAVPTEEGPHGCTLVLSPPPRLVFDELQDAFSDAPHDSKQNSARSPEASSRCQQERTPEFRLGPPTPTRTSFDWEATGQALHHDSPAAVSGHAASPQSTESHGALTFADALSPGTAASPDALLSVAPSFGAPSDSSLPAASPLAPLCRAPVHMGSTMPVGLPDAVASSTPRDRMELLQASGTRVSPTASILAPVQSTSSQTSPATSILAPAHRCGPTASVPKALPAPVPVPATSGSAPSWSCQMSSAAPSAAATIAMAVVEVSQLRIALEDLKERVLRETQMRVASLRDVEQNVALLLAEREESAGIAAQAKALDDFRHLVMREAESNTTRLEDVEHHVAKLLAEHSECKSRDRQAADMVDEAVATSPQKDVHSRSRGEELKAVDTCPPVVEALGKRLAALDERVAALQELHSACAGERARLLSIGERVDKMVESCDEARADAAAASASEAERSERAAQDKREWNERFEGLSIRVDALSERRTMQLAFDEHVEKLLLQWELRFHDLRAQVSALQTAHLQEQQQAHERSHVRDTEDVLQKLEPPLAARVEAALSNWERRFQELQAKACHWARCSTPAEAVDCVNKLGTRASQGLARGVAVGIATEESEVIRRAPPRERPRSGSRRDLAGEGSCHCCCQCRATFRVQ